MDALSSRRSAEQALCQQGKFEDHTSLGATRQGECRTNEIHHAKVESFFHEFSFVQAIQVMPLFADNVNALKMTGRLLSCDFPVAIHFSLPKEEIII